MKKIDKSSFSYEETQSSESQMNARKELEKLFSESPLPVEELMTQMGLYIRSSYLVKFLVLNDLYQRIKNIPGDIIEFGTRFGHNLVLFENLRSIYEPFNKTRKIIGFDTFEGYKNFSSNDKESEIYKENMYLTSDDYPKYIENLLIVHEKNNILGNIYGRHEVIKGDVAITSKEFFLKHKESIIALAYFDMGLYNPTKAALEAIIPHLISGSILLFDEFNYSEAPGETLAFKECLSDLDYSIETSSYTPVRAIVTIN